MPVMIEHAEGDKFWFGFYLGDSVGVYKGGKNYDKVKANCILRSIDQLGSVFKKVMLLAVVRGVGDSDVWEGDLDWNLSGGKDWMFISKPREGSVMRAYCKSTDKDTDPEGNWNWISAREGVEPDFSVNREGKMV